MNKKLSLKKIRNTILIVAIILMISSYTSWANYGAAFVPGRGVGAATCAQFAQDYKENPDETEAVYISWAYGMMTGLNLVKGTRRETIIDLSSKTIKEAESFLRHFCDEYPLKEYEDGVIELYGQFNKVPWKE